MKRLVFALMIFLSLGKAIVSLASQDSENIQSFNDMVNVRMFLGVTTLSVDFIATYAPSSARVSYQPNPSAGGYYGVGISWNGIGLSFVGDVPASDSDEEKYGKSSYENLSMFLYGKQYGIDLFYQRYQGYYLSNPEEFGLHEGDPATIRPDLALATLGMNAYYVFSGDFSLIGAFNQTERQLSSGGSFLFMMSVMRFTIESDGPLVPAAYDGGDYAGFYGGRFYSVAASPGYAYTLVYSGLYLTLGVFLGGGLIYQEMDVSSGEKSGFNTMLRTSVKSALGYNGESIFAGMLVIYDIVSGGTGELSAEQMIFNIEFFAGARF